MALTLSGVLPLSAVNLGLQASIAGLTAKVAKLGVDLTDFGAALEAGILVAADFPPDPTAYGAALASFTPADIIAAFDPTTWVALAADSNVDVGIRLGVVSLQVAAVGALFGALDIGLGAGKLWGWSYSGGARQFGLDLTAATQNGFGHTGPTEQIEATIIATESFTSWQQLASSMDLRDPAGLIFLGERTADRWSAQVADLRLQLGRFKAELDGLKANLEASLAFSLGINLPDPQVVIGAGASVLLDWGLDGLLENLVTVRSDLTATIGAIQADIDAILEMVAQLNAQLSAGGFAVWKYSGRAMDMGREFARAVDNGLPEGSGPGAGVYGLIIGGSGDAMSAFASIFV